MRPHGLGGALGDRFDVVTHMHGLGSFAEELSNTIEIDLCRWPSGNVEIRPTSDRLGGVT